MRLGDLDVLKAQLKKLPMMSNWGEAFIPRLIDEQPTIDAVPVVRCWECAHYKICDEWENGKRMLCEVHHHSYLDHDGDNHFCSWGQRKIETILPKSDAKVESLEDNHEVS